MKCRTNCKQNLHSSKYSQILAGNGLVLSSHPHSNISHNTSYKNTATLKHNLHKAEAIVYNHIIVIFAFVDCNRKDRSVRNLSVRIMTSTTKKIQRAPSKTNYE